MPEDLKNFITIPAEKKPIVLFCRWKTIPIKLFWLKTIVDAEVIVSSEDDLLSNENLELLLEK
ncbi:hypothetical protein ACNQF7_13680 [Flavobacterium sp. RSP29]